MRHGRRQRRRRTRRRRPRAYDEIWWNNRCEPMKSLHSFFSFRHIHTAVFTNTHTFSLSVGKPVIKQNILRPKTVSSNIIRTHIGVLVRYSSITSYNACIVFACIRDRRRCRIKILSETSERNEKRTSSSQNPTMKNYFGNFLQCIHI